MRLCTSYSRPASGQTEHEVFGLDVAITNLLSALFRHGTQERYFCSPIAESDFDHFRELAGKQGIPPERCVGFDPRAPQHNLNGVGCMFRADPLTADLIWRRHQLKGAGYATCGLVHTMSGDRIARAVNDLMLAPSDHTDALICPSEAIRDAVQELWAIHADYLNHRFKSQFRCPIQTPIIPLGIDTEKFARRATPDKRAQQRLALGASADEIVILFVGRLSFATKAHPLPLMLAAERAARATKRKIRLVMFGYFKPQDMEPRFRALAVETGQTASIEFIMNNDPRFPEGLWAGADIFTSLSDNIQESFGLTPIEAMASGLPAVISDWDGYRGSIRDGQEGFLIPTMTPPAAGGQALAEAYFNERNYGIALMGASQSTAVDIARCAEAFRTLADNDSLRETMGQNGRARAQSVFDWSHVIKAYEALWNDLAQRRQGLADPASALPANWPAAHPTFPNPWKMFGGFASVTLSPNDIVATVMSADGIASLFHHDMNFFLPDLLLPQPIMIELAETIRHAGPLRMRDILEVCQKSGFDEGRVWRVLGWLLKHGVCERHRP
ncbi:MAG: glycosyltransferase family 4 protein [Bdellovibrionales bacterium]